MTLALNFCLLPILQSSKSFIDFNLLSEIYTKDFYSLSLVIIPVLTTSYFFFNNGLVLYCYFEVVARKGIR